MFITDNVIVQLKPVMGVAVGIRYEEGLVGEGSHTLCFDLFIVTVFITW